MQTTFKNISDFKNALTSDTDLQNAFKNDPIEAASKINTSPLDYDVWIYRIVVAVLGIAILGIIGGVITLMNISKGIDDKNIPTILTALGSAAIGALSGLLAPSPKNTKAQ